MTIGINRDGTVNRKYKVDLNAALLYSLRRFYREGHETKLYHAGGENDRGER